MKADAPSTKFTAGTVPELRVPAWVPIEVINEAKDFILNPLHMWQQIADLKLADENVKAAFFNTAFELEREGRSPAEVVDILFFKPLRPLLTNNRMKRVWDELIKQHRDGRGYLHPVHNKLPERLEQLPNRQGAGMAWLFYRIIEVERASRPWASGTREQAEARNGELLKQAADLRGLVATYKQIHLWHSHVGIGGGKYRVWARKLEDAALVLEEIAQALPKPLKRRHDTDQARFIAGQLAKACQEIFGKSLPGVVRNILYVLFDRDFNDSTVTQWCKHPLK